MTVIADVAVVLLVVVVVVVGWGLVEPYVIDVETHEFELPDLPPAWDGRRVAVIADLQVGMWLSNIWTIRRIVRRIVDERPAVVLAAGDFVYEASKRPALARKAAGLLQPLVAAGIPTYAVLGNHDYDMPTKAAEKHQALADAVRRALEEVGIRVLENEAVRIPLPGGAAEAPVYLVGVGAHVPGHDDPEVAASGVPEGAARLVLMHHPNSFEALPPGSAPLAFAGHTHGGQFRIPFTPDWTWMTYTSDDVVHADGFDDDFGGHGNQLYVNRGIGFSVVPLRANCPPELTLFTLRRPAHPTAEGRRRIRTARS